MGSIMIYLTTIIILLLLISRSYKSNKKFKTSLNNLIKEINKVYKDLFKTKKNMLTIAQIGMILWASVFSFVSILTTINRYVDTHFDFSFDFLFKVIAIIISFVIVHYCIGYMLLISSKIHKFIHNVEDATLKVDFICIYFITSTFLTVLLVFPDNFNDNIFIGLIMIFICYLLNIKVLLTLMINPTNVKSYTEDETSFSRIMVASILILIMLIFNLYLAVCFVDGLGENIYLNSNGYFDLFYYTIITFTTIGYGDIIPTTIPSKIVAIIISISSVLCLTIFLSSVLSYKDTFGKNSK